MYFPNVSFVSCPATQHQQEEQARKEGGTMRCPKTRTRYFAARRRQRSRTCGALAFLLLIGPARASSSAKSRRRIGEIASVTAGSTKKNSDRRSKRSLTGFVVSSGVRSGSCVEGRLQGRLQNVEDKNWSRFPHSRGAASMTATTSIDSEVVSQQSR